jgi:glycine cleavage system H protein
MMRVLDFEIPDGLYYSKEHEWIRLEGKEAVIGITDYAQKQLHEIVYVEVQKKGTEIKQFQTMGTVESVKSVSDVFSPITGRITQVNTELSESPELLNQDPYGKGWLVRAEIADPAKDLTKLLTPQKYTEYIKSLEE